MMETILHYVSNNISCLIMDQVYTYIKSKASHYSIVQVTLGSFYDLRNLVVLVNVY